MLIKEPRMEPIYKLIKISRENYYVSTRDTFDLGLETMVFPAEADARFVPVSWYQEAMMGVDFESPFEEYTRHYSTVKEARAGHKETIAILERTEANNE